MLPIYSDHALRAVIAQIAETQPRSLWRLINGIAEFYALTGAASEALPLWEFAYAELPLPGQNGERWEGDDVAVTAICARLNYRDISGGALPMRDDRDKAPADLKARMWRYDNRARRSMTIDAWAPAPGYPGYEEPRIADIRRARALARPPQGARYSETELEALPLLDAFLADLGASPPGDYDAHLLYADICWRHERREQSREHLQAWGAIARRSNGFNWDAFAIPGLASLICQGELGFLSDLGQREKAALGDGAIAAARTRLARGTPAVSRAASVECAVFHSQFCLEPARHAAPDELFFGEAGDIFAWEAEAYPSCVSVSTPGETGAARFWIERAEAAPDWSGAAYAISFPFRVVPNERAGEAGARVGNVFFSSTMGGPEDVGLEVEPGDYDVLARFERTRGDADNESVGLRHWDVKLAFLPRGTLESFGVLRDVSWDEEAKDAESA